MELHDAHAHYHFATLAPFIAAALEEARRDGLAAGVVNGTCEEDWPQVREFVRKHPWTRAAYGIHPWQAPHRTLDWEEILRGFLLENPTASVGEIGLDAWVPGHNLADQTDLFRRQWALAVELKRPITVHCIQAWEPLRQSLRRAPATASGFLIHAYNGPPEWIPSLAELGAYFSFSPYFLHDRKRPQRDAFRLMPPDRILIETDAPALGPPLEHNLHLLTNPVTGEPLNHPVNLRVALIALAETLGCTPAAAAGFTAENWTRLFAPEAAAPPPPGASGDGRHGR